jgi:hypothetical protein
MSGQLTLTFAGDESGDVSFNFKKGASRNFVVAMVATSVPDSLRNKLAEVRQSSGLPASYEFKFHDLTSTALRKRTYAAIAEADFESWALIADKTSLPDTFRLFSSLDFYLYFVTELIRLIPAEKRKDATLILDEFGSAERMPGEIRRVLKARGIVGHFKRLLIKRSRSEPLIQVADLIAGAIFHRDAQIGSEAFELIQGKIYSVAEFLP